MPSSSSSTHARSSTPKWQQASRAIALVTGLATAGAVLAVPRTAHAEPVAPDGKGIVGTALLGGEVVVFAERIFGVRSGTAYILGAAGGAVAGGVGGYFIEQAVDDGRVPAYLLAGGLAALIPAVVVALDATRYIGAEGARDDKPVQNLPASDPGKPGGSSVIGAPASTPSAPSPSDAPPPGGTAPAPGGTGPAPTPPAGGGGGGTQGPQSLLNLRDGNLFVGLPVPEVRPALGALSAADRSKLGADSRGSEVRFPVVRITF